MVVTSAPSAWAASTVQLFTDSPSRWTVQAPQLVVSQPMWVPVNPSSSRSQCTSKVLAATSDSRRSPLTVTPIRTVAPITLSPRVALSWGGMLDPRASRTYRVFVHMEPATDSFDFEGHRLVYDEYGSGDRLGVVGPGPLFTPQK